MSNNKKQKTNDDNTSTLEATTANNLLCVICMEEDREEEPLLDHNCPQCKLGAWKICEECDDRCLSKECPVCRQPYSPMILYPFPTINQVTTLLQSRLLASSITCDQSKVV